MTRAALETRQRTDNLEVAGVVEKTQHSGRMWMSECVCVCVCACACACVCFEWCVCCLLLCVLSLLHLFIHGELCIHVQVILSAYM